MEMLSACLSTRLLWRFASLLCCHNLHNCCNSWYSTFTCCFEIVNSSSIFIFLSETISLYRKYVPTVHIMISNFYLLLELNSREWENNLMRVPLYANNRSCNVCFSFLSAFVLSKKWRIKPIIISFPMPVKYSMLISPQNLGGRRSVSLLLMSGWLRLMLRRSRGGEAHLCHFSQCLLTDLDLKGGAVWCWAFTLSNSIHATSFFTVQWLSSLGKGYVFASFGFLLVEQQL